MTGRSISSLFAASALLLCCTGTGPTGGVESVVPYTPLGVVAVPGDGFATVSWLVPPQSESATERNVIIQYTVTSDPGGITANCPGDVFGVTVGNPDAGMALEDGTSYTFTVIATNQAGNSMPSAPSNPVTPSSVPGVPTNVMAYSAGEDSATITWTPPANSGGSQIIGYVVQATPGGVIGGESYTVNGTMTTATITDLDDAITYSFTVVAENDIGQGPPSSMTQSVTTLFPPSVVPAVPAITGFDPADAGSGEWEVYWQQPQDTGGTFISGYDLTLLQNGTTVQTQTTDGATLIFTFDGLTTGLEYTLQIVAVNLAGQSTPSSYTFTAE